MVARRAQVDIQEAPLQSMSVYSVLQIEHEDEDEDDKYYEYECECEYAHNTHNQHDQAPLPAPQTAGIFDIWIWCLLLSSCMNNNHATYNLRKLEIYYYFYFFLASFLAKLVFFLDLQVANIHHPVSMINYGRYRSKHSSASIYI